MTQQFKEPESGDIIADRYRIDSELGRGGFGIVFRAEHMETQRLVAVKVLHSTFALSEPTAVERFRREAILSASLQYPNTVSLYDYGETDEGVFFIVMEYLIGSPLNRVLHTTGGFTVQRALHVTRQILYSIWEAHEKDIVHRDIKPENIMITPLLYDQDFVKVMDFGIAKIASGSGPQITKAGQTFGTPRYMAPEQLQGRPIAPTTDLYAVGLLLYEMLVGEPAIEDGNLAAVISEVIFGPAVSLPPSLDIPQMVRDVVERACSKEVETRYQTAREFLADIDCLEGHEERFDEAPDTFEGPAVAPDLHEAATAALDTSIARKMMEVAAATPTAESEVQKKGGSTLAIDRLTAATDRNLELFRYGCIGGALLGLLGWASAVLLAVILVVR